MGVGDRDGVGGRCLCGVEEVEEMGDGATPWAQLKDEANEAYARFLIYRNLGPTRSVDAAYVAANSIAPKRTKSHHHKKASKSSKLREADRRASGQWKADSARYQWSERAAAWDVHVLAEAGQQVVVKFVATLDASFTKLLHALADKRIRPKDWDSVVESLTIIGNFVPQETIAAIRRDAAADHSADPVGNAAAV